LVVAKGVIKAHEEFKEKQFEFEASWITRGNGLKHQIIPLEDRKRALTAAENEIEEED
jgi:hypothetical protein